MYQILTLVLLFLHSRSSFLNKSYTPIGPILVWWFSMALLSLSVIGLMNPIVPLTLAAVNYAAHIVAEILRRFDKQ